MCIYSDTLFNTLHGLTNTELMARAMQLVTVRLSSLHGTVPALMSSVAPDCTPALHSGHFKQGHHQEKHKAARNVAKNRKHKGSWRTVSELNPKGRRRSFLISAAICTLLRLIYFAFCMRYE